MTMQVLSLGSGQGNHIVQLASAITGVDDSIRIDIDHFTSLSDEVSHAQDQVFAHQYSFGIKGRVPRILGFLSHMYILLNKEIRRDILYVVAAKPGRYKLLFRFLRDTVLDYMIVKKQILPLKHDFYIFNSCTAETLRYLRFLPSSAKTICYFYGSDLFRNSDLVDYYFVHKLLRKTTLIGAGTPEMQDAVLAKFGRDLKPKLRATYSSIHKELYDLIDRFRDDDSAKAAFCSKYGISPGKLVIVIGHNASPFNHHIEILNAVSRLPQNLKDTIECIIPLTYDAGGDEAYKQRVKKNAKITGLNLVFLEKFMDWDDLALFRLTTDILVMMPESEGLSGAMREGMFAGNVFITADWLTYQVLRKIGLYYLSVPDFSQLTGLLERLVSGNLGEHQRLSAPNRDLIVSSLFPDAVGRRWVSFIKE
jgi:hypothetical protein